MGVSRRVTASEFVEIMAKVSPDIEIADISEYKNTYTEVVVHCKTCGHTWRATPKHLYRGQGKGGSCPKCSIRQKARNQWLTDEEFITKLSRVRSDLEPLEPYQGAHKKIKFQCQYCKEVIELTPVQACEGKRCPSCGETCANGEKSLINIFDAEGVVYEPQAKFDGCEYKRALSYDFYLPDFNICIEYDGVQHFVPVVYFGGKEAFEKTKIRDSIKNLYCRTHNIRLLRIPYTCRKQTDIKKILRDFGILKDDVYVNECRAV